MKFCFSKQIILKLVFILLLNITWINAKVSSKKTNRRSHPKSISLAKNIDKLAKPILSNPHSTKLFSKLSKVAPSHKILKKTSLAELQKILKDNKTDSVVKTSKSTDKNNSIIKQSMGVKNLETLDDIFKKNTTQDISNNNSLKKAKKKARGLNDDEESENNLSESSEEHSEISEGSGINANDEYEKDDEFYTDEHEMKSETSSDEDKSEKDEPFHIQDLSKVSELVESIKENIKAEILGDLQNKMMIKKLEVSFEVYEDINQVRKRYHFYKDSVEQSVQLLKDLVDYLEEFVTDSEEDESIKKALEKKGIEIDEHNHKLLQGLLIKLQQYVNKLHSEIFDTFNDYFKELDNIHFNDKMADSEKVRKMIQIASELAIFENNVLDELTEQIQEVAKLSMDNPRYDHLSKAFIREFTPPGDLVEEKLSRESSKIISGMLIMIISFVLL